MKVATDFASQYLGISLVAFQDREAHLVFHRQQTGKNDANRADKLRQGIRHPQVGAKVVAHPAQNAGKGVNLLAENKGHLVDKRIAQDTPRRPRERAHDNGNPNRVIVGDALLNPDNGEKPQPDGVKNKERVVQADDILAKNNDKPQRRRRHHHVGHLLHPKRGDIQKEVANRTAPDCRHKAHNIRAEPVKPLGGCQADAADGKGKGA